MSATTLFKPCGIGNYEWLSLDNLSAEASGEFSVGDSERLGEEAANGNMVLIAPADKISLRGAYFDPAEKKLLRQTLPYSLEDDLAVDVDDLHFALGEPVDNTVDLAIIKRDILDDWKEQFSEQQLDVQAIVSELQLLPLEDNAWTLLIKDEQWLIRFGESKGFAIEPQTATLALQLLLDEAETLPEKLLVYARGADQAAILNQLPEMLRGIVDWRDSDYWQVIAQGYRQATRRINLFQGDYALGLPWKKWWRVWKTAAIVFVAAVVLNIVMAFVQLQVLESRNLELRTETERAYRSAIPRGAVMDPARQLKSKVDALRSTGGEGFVSVFARVATVLASVKGVELQGVNYTEKQTELRLTILAQSFNDVETVRASLEKAGLKAELTGSNSEGSKTRARLRVRG